MVWLFLFAPAPDEKSQTFVYVHKEHLEAPKTTGEGLKMTITESQP